MQPQTNLSDFSLQYLHFIVFRTALAEAELQYNKHHKSTCVTVRVPLLTKPFNISVSGTLYALIWTTTPWTLPANEAINYKSDLQYSIVHIEGLDGHYIVASKLVSELEQKLSKRIEEVQTIPGKVMGMQEILSHV